MEMQKSSFAGSGAVFVQPMAAWLRISGADAAAFLQGQFTNDLRRLVQGERAVYGLWLNQKGRVLADSFVLRGAGETEFWVGSYFSPATVVRQRLEDYIIADDVMVEDATAEWTAVSLIGEGAVGWLTECARGGWVFPGRRAREESAEWVFPMARLAAVRSELGGVREIDSVEMARRRIAAGIPAVPVDIGPADLPNEAGLDGEAVSFTKGCYLGQEVMARLKSMGQVRRRLLRVAGGAAAVPPLPAALWQGGRQIGELRSAVPSADGSGFSGLAMLSLLQLKPGDGLTVGADGGPEVRVMEAL